ncbi:tripartite tricarboxylate transporter substrate binding protein [Roseiarcaceae bacterium H3SJ34-1]|uniref:Bug family tripartite tricarboxylate transporter substrate binding protein n=1 Tax=Terripilifer ovatus TaxID=3032367 RepID=UPI003AB95B43|nr:tripartite tricarboxylate transporter substrate binding protein [Roseiarcaceae bacterium H3SJ34-1]
MDRRQFVTALASASAALATGIAPAIAEQDYPRQLIKAIVGFAPGSGADILARYYSKKLEELCGKPVIIENKPGATSNLALSIAAAAKPDGYTMLFSANSNMAGTPYLFKDMSFDVVKDFTPVALLSQTSFFLVVAPNSPLNTIADLTKHLKSTDRAKYAYTNQTAQIATEYYKVLADVQAVPVSYRTAADTVPDVQNGAIDFMIIDGTFGSGQIKAGRLKPLACTASTRHPSFPNVPTMAESGVADYEFASWWAAWLPKGAAPEIVARLEGWFKQIMAMDETKEFLAPVAGTPLSGGSKETAERQRREMEKWKRVTAAAGIKPQ